MILKNYSSISSDIFEMAEFTSPPKSCHLSCCHVLGIVSYKAADNLFVHVDKINIYSILLKSGRRITHEG